MVHDHGPGRSIRVSGGISSSALHGAKSFLHNSFLSTSSILQTLKRASSIITAAVALSFMAYHTMLISTQFHFTACVA